MAGRTKSKGLLYLRRSGDRQESSLETQLRWALDEAAKHGVNVEASVEDLQHMQAQRLCRYRSIRLDDAISGSELKRPGLDALRSDVASDSSISHVFVYRRDRLGRPNDPVDMMQIEQSIRSCGVTIARSDGVAGPFSGATSDIGELFRMLAEYQSSGDFLRQLSERVLRTQLQLAREGRWTGGNAPYGFARALIDAQGNILEELPPGKSVRQPGCHVVILPVDEEKIARWLNILQLKEQGWGYKRIANHLNDLGIPSPAAGSYRTDHGVRHKVSGKWNHTTIRDICRNRAILGIVEYGRRSEGQHWRTSPDGPRPLEESDMRDGKAQRIFNAPDQTVRGELPCEPQFDVERWESIQLETAKRACCQGGTPRVRDPARYPLSCRVVDLTDSCNSVMYARTVGKRRVYNCGRYMRTGGQECENNQVDGEALLRFTQQSLSEIVDRLGAHNKLREKLLERAVTARNAEDLPDPRGDVLQRLRSQAQTLDDELATVKRNLAIEKDDELREVVREEYRRIKAEHDKVTAELADLEVHHTNSTNGSPEDEVDAAMALFDEMHCVCEDKNARADMASLVQKLGVRIGLNFVEGIKGKKRKVRRLAGGVLTFGDRLVPFHGHRHGGNDAPMPSADPSQQPKRKGKGRKSQPRKSNGQPGKLPVPAELPTKSSRESISSTKDSRGDRRHERPSVILGSCLFDRAIAFSYEFSAEEFFALGSTE